MGFDPVDKVSTSHPALWPGTMGILAGVDLLAKFYAGNDTDKVGPRFQVFVKAFFQPLTSGDDEAIYQLRNAMLHSFGLYSKAKTKTYHFVLGQKLPSFISYQAPEYCIVDINALHQRFESAIGAYQEQLESSPDLQCKFTAMFPNYGFILMANKGVQGTPSGAGAPDA
jgi:hypothetical protein